MANVQGRRGVRFQSWGNTGVENTDGWSKSSFPNKSEAQYDHVCRPVIIGSDGRAMPGVLDCPLNHQKEETFITKTETVVEKVYRPQPASANTNWYESGELNRGEAPKVQEFTNNFQNSAIGGGRMGFPGSMFQHQKANQNSYYGEAEPAIITTGVWARPSPQAWATPPSYDGRLGKATNDVSTAVDFLREPPNRRSSASTSIDSREAARRYGGQFL